MKDLCSLSQVHHAARLGCAVCVCLVAGCGWVAPGSSISQLPPQESWPAGERVPDGSPDLPVEPPTSLAAPEPDWGVLQRGVEEGDDGRRRSVWIRTIPNVRGTEGGPAPAPQARWRYPDLDEILARPRKRQPAFDEALSHADPVVATNAAIALARLGDASGAEQLFAAVQSPTLPMPMRCAAVEALGSLPGEEPTRLLGELLEQYGQSAGGSEGRRVYVPELHAELIAALGQRISPADDPRFLAALNSSSADVRLESLRTWANDETSPLPEALIELRAAGDIGVRMAALEAIAARRHPDAHRLLGEALRDHDLRVKLAAVDGLGELGNPEATAVLENLLDHHAARIREAAVKALAHSEAYEAVMKAAEDQSWRVRAEVARALAGCHDRQADAVARKLLDDPSTEVHRELLAAIGKWPVEKSAPILLIAMGKDSYVCRKSAAELLAAQWPPAASFSAEGTPDRRQLQLQQLTEEFRSAFPPGDDAPDAQVAVDQEQAPAVDEINRVEQLLANEDIAGLIALGTRAIGAIEVVALQRHRPIPEAVYRSALPEIQPVFALLARLETDDVLERRRAAAELEGLARKEPLGRLAVERLCQLATPEPDSLVFQSALSAVAGDGSDAAQRLAYAAVGHPATEVRRRGCLHLVAHPDPRHVPVLLPAVEDESASVAAAAAEALGACGHPAAADALNELMRSGNEALQLEAALALVQLNPSRGAAALERLAHSRDAAVRRRIAEEMGELADPAFTPTLIRLLDDQVSVMRAALNALPKTVGKDQSISPDGAPSTTTERARRWKAWFASQ